MANTINDLIPDMYAALDIVSRELVGFIPAVSRDATTERAAVGQEVRAFQTRAAVATDITPGVTPPDDGDQTLDNVALTITKARRVPFRWNGEQARGLNNGGAGLQAIMVDQIAQALRTLTNEMEADCAALAKATSRAYGTAETLPFDSSKSAGNDTAWLKKILDDNGTPASDRQLVISTGAGANLRSHSQLQKQNETGAPDFLRQGTLIDMNGFAIRESAKTTRPASGTGAGYLVNQGGGYAVGDTAITVDTGAGTVLDGEVVTFAGDTNKYIVAAGLAANVVTLAAPGLLQPLADNAAMTVVATSTRNVAFRRSSLVLAARLPALVNGEDMAVERSLVQDPLSGFAFEIAKYQQYRQTQWEICAAWGVKGVKPEHAAVLLGE